MLFSQQCKQLVISTKLLTWVSCNIIILQILDEKLVLLWSFMFSGLTASLACVVSSADITFAPLSPHLGFDQRSYTHCAWRVIAHGSVFFFQWCSELHSAFIKVIISLCHIVWCGAICAYMTKMYESSNDFICRSKSATLQSATLQKCDLAK